MSDATWLDCPVCRTAAKDPLLTLNCGNLDGSTLYPTVRLVACRRCGHTFNDLLPTEIAGLTAYYNNEYAPTNLQSVVKDGDLPGSVGKFTQDRYRQLYELLAPHVRAEDAVLDVGCAVGGFLSFLQRQGFTRLHGVDMAQAYVTQGRQLGHAIELGQAEALPYADASFDLLVVEQVLEHLIDPVIALREARRVLKEGGVLCIGVPDAARYDALYYFDFYWVLMREHVQHFSVASLARLAADSGFELLDYRQSAHPIMGEKMVMPNLCAAFRKRATPSVAVTATVAPSPDLARYVARETARLQEKKALLAPLAARRQPVYVWGIGREFLYLYEAAGLKDCALAGLIDMNPYKQQTVRVAGRPVQSPDILSQAAAGCALLISAVAHAEGIAANARSHGFAGALVALAAGPKE